MRPYCPDLGIAYPENPGEHVLRPKKIRELKIDADYPYLDKSFGFRFMRALMHLGIFVIVFAIIPFRFGLKIEGRKNLRNSRLKDGAMVVSNHIHRWDFLLILRALRYRLMYFPAWKENLLGSDMDFIRLAGGIPIPEDIHSIKYFNRAFDELHDKKIWIHAFPESAMWPYYRPVRPFKKGVFTLAHRYNAPVLPVAFSYAEPRFPLTIVNLFRKTKYPSVVARIGEPLFFDTEKPRKESVLEMRKKCHEEIVRLAGIDNNPWPAEAD